ncbi:prenyltransferase [Clostridium paraputrificum]|uniref:prenyltransferase n=1 Tax=Clostridium paraputrificum TaxID=29363 RepID=UPI00248136EB|nr:prenyltransferase [Clostridium paraputrificum]MDB2085429.1 prenyltransferase [Clostridium paraputrificum]
MKNLTKDYLKKFIKDSWIAFRPLSLTLAVASTTLGIIAAYLDGSMKNHSLGYNIFLITIITIAGILAQGGANLVNDYFEGDFRYYRPSGRKRKFLGVERTYFDIYVFLLAMACFAGAALIGLALIYLTDIRMFWIGLVGIIGAYAYTGEPFVYKTKGLGVPLSFILMGPLMVLGAYFPFSQSLNVYPILIALPASLMISNEMRDFQRDTKLSLGTLSVRLGSRFSSILYRSLIYGVYVLSLLFVFNGLYPLSTLVVFITLPLAVKALRAVTTFQKLGIPYTNNLHWTFTLILIVSLLLG